MGRRCSGLRERFRMHAPAMKWVIVIGWMADNTLDTQRVGMCQTGWDIKDTPVNKDSSFSSHTLYSHQAFHWQLFLPVNNYLANAHIPIHDLFALAARCPGGTLINFHCAFDRCDGVATHIENLTKSWQGTKSFASKRLNED